MKYSEYGLCEFSEEETEKYEKQAKKLGVEFPQFLLDALETYVSLTKQMRKGFTFVGSDTNFDDSSPIDSAKVIELHFINNRVYFHKTTIGEISGETKQE